MWSSIRLMTRMLQLFTFPYTSFLSPLLHWNSFASHLSSPLPFSPGCSLDDVIHSQDHLGSLTSRDENLALHLKGFCHSQLHHVTHTPTIHVCMWQCTANSIYRSTLVQPSLIPSPTRLPATNGLVNKVEFNFLGLLPKSGKDQWDCEISNYYVVPVKFVISNIEYPLFQWQKDHTHSLTVVQLWQRGCCLGQQVDRDAPTFHESMVTATQSPTPVRD